MISAKDRIPVYPGRVKLVQVPGQTDTFDMTRFDSPTEAGTPLDRRTMQLFQGDIRTLPVAVGNTVAAGDVVDVVGGAATLGFSPVGNCSVGTIIKLKESGMNVEYIVVHQGRPSTLYDTSCNGTWVLRKDIVSSQVWNSTNNNIYASGELHAYLNGTFLSLFDSNTAAAIKQVKIPYRSTAGPGSTVSSGASGLQCKIFAPSGYEVGFSTGIDANFPVDGALLSYFLLGTGASAKALRISENAGVKSFWRTRSPNSSNSSWVWHVTDTGNNAYGNANNALGARPMFILDPAYFAQDTSPRSQAIALQSGTGGQSIDILYDGVAELSGITGGTQITSTGVQGYAPQDGWLWVKPAWDAKPFVIGSYTGDDTAERFISLGFTPSAVLLVGRQSQMNDPNNYLYGGLALVGLPVNWANGYESALEIVTNGFKIRYVASGTGSPHSNQAGPGPNPFRYVAWR